MLWISPRIPIEYPLRLLRVYCLSLVHYVYINANMQALVWKPLPSLVFGILSTISGLLYVILPETLGQVLPDTVEQAERFGRRSPTKSGFVFTSSSTRVEHQCMGSLHVFACEHPLLNVSNMNAYIKTQTLCWKFRNRFFCLYCNNFAGDRLYTVL